GPVVRGKCKSQPSSELQAIPPTLAQTAHHQKVAGVSDIDPFAAEDAFLHFAAEGPYLRIALNFGFQMGWKAGLEEIARQRQCDQQNALYAEAFGAVLHFMPIRRLVTQQPRNIANPSQASPCVLRAVHAGDQQKILGRERARVGIAETRECCPLK